MKSTKYRNFLEKRRGQAEILQDQLEGLKKENSRLQKQLRFHEQAKEFIKQVGLKTQKQISYNVSEITSMALDSVLDNPYKLTLNFIERRNKTECVIEFVRDEISIDPFSGGGGAVDVASFALRIASWSMQKPKSRPVLILDEPFKHLKGETTNQKMLEMVKQISQKLNIQIIMVSDERVSREATIAATDNLIETRIRKGITKIK